MKKLFLLLFIFCFGFVFTLSPNFYFSFDHGLNLIGFNDDEIPESFYVGEELRMDGRLIAGYLFVQFPFTFTLALELDSKEKELGFQDFSVSWFGDTQSFSIGIQNVFFGEGSLSNPVFFLEKLIPIETFFSYDGNESRAFLIKFDQYFDLVNLSFMYISDKHFLNKNNFFPWQSFLVRSYIPIDTLSLDFQFGLLKSNDSVFFEDEPITVHEGISISYLFYKNNSIQFSQGLATPLNFLEYRNDWNLAITLLNETNEVFIIPELYSKDKNLFAGCSIGYTPSNFGITAHCGINYDLDYAGYNMFSSFSIPLTEKFLLKNRLNYFKAIDTNSSFGKNILYTVDVLLSFQY